MQQVRFEIVIQAEQAIAHAEGTIGNVSVAMTRKVRLPDGAFVRVPIVTGDTMRHKLREAITYATLDAAGLLDTANLSAAALRLLFNGGMLTGRGDANAVKLDEYRALMAALPHLALLGGCANNHMIPGQISVSDALLLCDETKHLAPTWVLEWLAANGITLSTSRAHMDEEQRVRMDATLDPGKRRLLSGEARDHVERRLNASEQAHADDNAVAREASKSTMLPRTAEVIAPGSLFMWDVTATVYSDLDIDTLHTMIAAFLANARVGGKSGTGHGKIRGLIANRVELARPSVQAESVDLTALAPKMGETFRAHVGEHKEALRKVLASVDA
jgi:hypothetical protein